MARAEDAARFMIDILRIKAEHGLDDGMTNLRLHKLMYLAQGYYLAEYDQPLFAEEIEAWKYGPVVPSIYKKYSIFNKDIIDDDPPNEGSLNAEETELILDVLSRFGKYSTGYLVDMTQAPGAPWEQVYKATKNNRIDRELIRIYFKNQKKITRNEEKVRTKLYQEVRRGKTGYILLPEEEFEDWEEYASVSLYHRDRKLRVNHQVDRR